VGPSAGVDASENRTSFSPAWNNQSIISHQSSSPQPSHYTG